MSTAEPPVTTASARCDTNSNGVRPTTSAAARQASVASMPMTLFWQRFLGWPVSESGRLRHRDGATRGATATGQC